MGIWEYVILESTIDKIGTKLVILSLIENPTLGFLQKRKKTVHSGGKMDARLKKRKGCKKFMAATVRKMLFYVVCP